MIEADVAMALGLSAGGIVGLSLRGALVAGLARSVAVAVGMTMLALTVFVSCGVAWTYFAWYTGSGGWAWFGVGLVAGLLLGEVAVRVGAETFLRGRTGGRHAAP
jgi:hypothetical protein